MNGENDPKDFIKQMLISETNISQITNVTPVSDSTTTGKDKNSYQINKKITYYFNQNLTKCYFYVTFANLYHEN